MKKHKSQVLITGGLGYIGSHTCLSLLENGYTPIIFDNLSNSKYEIINSIELISGVKPLLYIGDIRSKSDIERVFNECEISAIIHFASLKSVSESHRRPLDYFDNNVLGLINLIDLAEQHNCNNMIFSSSCTVYGEAVKSPVNESTKIQSPKSPYGRTKIIGEQILTDCFKTSIKSVILRYFNPIGAHESGKLGEFPNGVPENLIPYLTQTAAGLRDELKIYGNDYDTPDGTAIRDYIHIQDLSQAHVVAMDYLLTNSDSLDHPKVYNVGTGTGKSVLEVVKTFEKVNSLEVPFSFASRREGDIPSIFADSSKIQNELGWRHNFSLADSLKSAWEWEKNRKLWNK